MNINELRDRAHGLARAKGFWPEGQERPFPTLVMLVVGELAEAVEADRAGKYAAINEFGWPKGVNLDESMKDPYVRDGFEAAIKDTVEDEIADAIIRLMDLAGGMGIDIQKHIEMKLAYNAGRPVRHGKRY